MTAVETLALQAACAHNDGLEQAAIAFETAIAEGYRTPADKREQCQHGKFGWEDCIACYDDALQAAVDAIRALKTPVAKEGER